LGVVLRTVRHEEKRNEKKRGGRRKVQAENKEPQTHKLKNPDKNLKKTREKKMGGKRRILDAIALVKHNNFSSRSRRKNSNEPAFSREKLDTREVKIRDQGKK